jgi:hypothetical protein
MFSKKELVMSVQNFAMFSEAGDFAVGLIVEIAKAKNLSWPETYQLLSDLASSDYDKFGEATDTAVREMVYMAIGAGARDEYFYF